MNRRNFICFTSLFYLFACTSPQSDIKDSSTFIDTSLVDIDSGQTTSNDEAYRVTQSIEYNNIAVDIIIDKPVGTDFDVLVVYHGTVGLDSKIHEAATTTLNEFERILDRTDMMIVSVVYPEEGLQMGDNLIFAEAALLWVREKADEELGINVQRVFLGGHSQGGYIVTRLNTMHQTDGVVANCPGPLNLIYRCNLEELGEVQPSATCQRLKNEYGTTTENPQAYAERSLLNFTTGHTSRMLFIQGMQDSEIQLYSWPNFKQQLSACTDCEEIRVVEEENAGHSALFVGQNAMQSFNSFVE